MNCSLQIPTSIATNIYGKIIHEFNNEIHRIFKKPFVKLNFIEHINHKINVDYLNSCTIHDLKIIFINISFEVLIFAFVTNINKILKGEKVYQLCSKNNKIQFLASSYYSRYVKNKKK